MKDCSTCNDNARLVSVTGKVSDCFGATFTDHYVNGPKRTHDGYVPSDLGIGGGDYVEFTYCLNCGQIQGEWPRPTTALERGEDDAD